ncbi:MAG: translation initiation factor IF-2, partial [Candidatus Altarchaeaceae archaeon]
MTIIRNPIITVLGHVDHGKTSLLDSIRRTRTTVASKEPGAITQHIGATNVDVKHIKALCGEKYKIFFEKLKIPGLLFIDTPGHSAFTNLRKRGGSIADLAILVIDINEGIMPQTIESIEILKTFKVPFVIALNKVDKIPGWEINTSADKQDDYTMENFNKKFYKIANDINKYGFTIEKFYNMTKENFTQIIAAVPVSATKNYGISDLLLVLIGLSQTFLTKKLEIDDNAPGEGVIMEVKEEKGYGTTIDVILYNGVIKKNDIITVGGKKPIITKVRNLLLPPLESEIRVTKKFLSVDKVVAAAGLKIYAPNLEDAIAGMPIYVGEEIEKIKREMMPEIQTSEKGVIIKADTLGTLEAISKMLKEKGIPIKIANVGKVTKEDIINAQLTKEIDEEIGVMFI